MRKLHLSIAFGLAGCSAGFEERSTQVRFEPGTLSFWDLPFPSPVERPLGLSTYPTPTSAITEAWLATADELLPKHGQGLTNGVFFTTTGPVDSDSLPKSYEVSRSAESPVMLIDIDPESPERGQRTPLDVTFHETQESSRPGNALALLPARGFVRRPNTLYAAVVTDELLDESGEPLGRSRSFFDAITGEDGADAESRAALEPLRTYYEEEDLDLDTVVGATVFRTMDPSARVAPLVELVENGPQPTLASAFEPAEDYPDYRVYRATFEMPKVQEGVRPGEGHIVYGPDGKPQKTGSQTCRLVLAVPKSPMPASGFPLVIYNHGSGGEAYEGVDRGAEEPSGPPPLPDAPPGTGPAAYLARHGIALVGFDFPLHGERRDPPDTTGLDFYSLFGTIDDKYSIRQTVDNMPVAAMESVFVSRLVSGLEISESLAPELDAGGAQDGLVRFDPERLVGFGHSMGTTLGVVIAGHDPRVKAWVFSGAGGGLVELANETTYPTNLKGVVQVFLALPEGEQVSFDHPLLHIFESVWDFVDPVAVARRVAIEPFAGHEPRPFLMYAGVIDGYFHPGAETRIAAAIGATLVGDSVEPTLPDALKVHGRNPVAYPLSKNLSGVTGGVVHYETPFELGHWVAFDIERARAQYLCFIKGVGTSEGPVITEGGTDENPCP